MPLNPPFDTIAAWGIGFLIMSLIGIAMGRIAQSKNHSFWLGFGLTFATSPLGAWLILVFIVEDRPFKHDPEFLMRVELEKTRYEAEQRAKAAEQP